jgi:hypothetical protein
MTKVLGDIFGQSLVDAETMNAKLSPMTDFERSVMEDIIDFGEEAFGLNKNELIVDDVIDPITRRYWASKLG